MREQKQKGISLITLIITIIIMIILATAVILSLTSSGIIEEAKRAKEAQELSNARDIVAIAYGEWTIMSETAKQETPFPEYAQTKLKEAGIEEGKYTISEDAVVTLKGEEIATYVEGVLIPEGFYYVGGTKDTGIVISDDPADKDAEKDKTSEEAHVIAQTLVGNQFVWVPVETFSEFQRENFKTNSTYNFTTTPKEANKYFEIQYTVGGTKEVDRMYASVEKYKGFYIARYEAGDETAAVARASGASTTVPAVSKANQFVYNFIPWGGLNTDTSVYDGAAGNETLDGAVKVARGMYKEDDNATGVVSTLIYGVQWDTVLRWMDSTKTTNNMGTYLTDSTNKGNYSNSTNRPTPNNPARTGAVDAYKVNNIYDMAGNVFEWTMEAYGSSYRISRGGKYSNGGGDRPVSHRGNGHPSDSSDSFGLRVALYLK